MKFSLEAAEGITIRGYGEGHVVLSLPPRLARSDESELRSIETVRSSVLLTAEHLFREWPPEQFEQIERVHFEQLLTLEPEVVLFGSGERLRFPDAAIGRLLNDHGIGLEVMDTGAACRTFNVLAAEGRRVAAALLMI